MKNQPHLYAILILFSLVLNACAPSATTTQGNNTLLAVNPDAGKNVRDTRYCEVLPVYRDGADLKAEVFNTLGLNDCPQDLWEKLNIDDLKKRTGALAVNLNGPRAWAMDTIIGRGVSAQGKQATFGGITMIQRATLKLSIESVRRGQPIAYQEQPVDRDSTYVYKAGKPIRQLISAIGRVYVMQTYDLKTVPGKDALTNLGARLTLPNGWQYREVLLQSDLELSIQGQATITRDDLQNTYQFAPNLKP